MLHSVNILKRKHESELRVWNARKYVFMYCCIVQYLHLHYVLYSYYENIGVMSETAKTILDKA
jgi:hypothetical protein